MERNPAPLANSTSLRHLRQVLVTSSFKVKVSAGCGCLVDYYYVQVSHGLSHGKTKGKWWFHEENHRKAMVYKGKTHEHG